MRGNRMRSMIGAGSLSGNWPAQRSVILVHTEPSITTPLFSQAQRVPEASLTVADRVRLRSAAAGSPTTIPSE